MTRWFPMVSLCGNRDPPNPGWQRPKLLVWQDLCRRSQSLCLTDPRKLTLRSLSMPEMPSPNRRARRAMQSDRDNLSLDHPFVIGPYDATSLTAFESQPSTAVQPISGNRRVTIQLEDVVCRERLGGVIKSDRRAAK